MDIKKLIMEIVSKYQRGLITEDQAVAQIADLAISVEQVPLAIRTLLVMPT